MIQIRTHRAMAINVAPNPLEITYWIDIKEDPNGGIVKIYKNGKWQAITGGEGGSGLTPEQMAKLNAIVITGDGNSYLANDGTYKPVNGVNFNTYPNSDSFPRPGETQKLYLDASSGNLYYWDGSDYHVIDEGLFNNYVTLNTAQTIVSVKTFNADIRCQRIVPVTSNTWDLGTVANNFANIYVDSVGSLAQPSNNGYFENLYLSGNSLADAVLFNSDDNIILRPGTKIAGTGPDGGVSHEVFGINEYTDSNGDYDQLEVGSQAALYNINILQDDERTLGHATADIYNANGSYNRKEIFAYISDITPKRLSATGVSTITIPAQSILVSVNYNRLMLFESDYTNVSGVITIINTDITGTIEPTDKIEVTYLI